MRPKIIGHRNNANPVGRCLEIRYNICAVLMYCNDHLLNCTRDLKKEIKDKKKLKNRLGCPNTLVERKIREMLKDKEFY